MLKEKPQMHTKDDQVGKHLEHVKHKFILYIFTTYEYTK
jgi:hypothetical protein